MTNLLATGSAEDLKAFMAEAELFVEPENRKTLTIVAQDATPVYLDRWAHVLDETKHRRLAKNLVEAGKAEHVVQLTGLSRPNDAQGSSRLQKNRLTFFMRQSLHGVFDPDVVTPEGRIRDGVLLVQATQHARLEDMSYSEPSYWLREHHYKIDGKPVSRKAGDKVGPLGSGWRNLRREMPNLFYKKREGPEEEWQHENVRVWFQPKATEDGVIAAWLSDLVVEEGDKFSMSSTDCVACEHTPELRVKKWLNNSVQHTIGMRQTAKTQVTDVRFARAAKVAATPVIEKCRQRMRAKARERNCTPQILIAKHRDLIEVARAMQQACIDDNEQKQGVLKAFRMCGWLAYRPTAKGLVKTTDMPGYEKFPLGSSRLSDRLINQRYDWLDEEHGPWEPSQNPPTDIGPSVHPGYRN